MLAEHFPAGSGSPVQVLAPEAKAQQVVDVLSREDGVNDPYAGLAPGAPPKVVDGNVVVQATLTAAGRTARRPTTSCAGCAPTSTRSGRRCSWAA